MMKFYQAAEHLQALTDYLNHAGLMAVVPTNSAHMPPLLSYFQTAELRHWDIASELRGQVDDSTYQWLHQALSVAQIAMDEGCDAKGAGAARDAITAFSEASGVEYPLDSVFPGGLLGTGEKIRDIVNQVSPVSWL